MDWSNKVDKKDNICCKHRTFRGTEKCTIRLCQTVSNLVRSCLFVVCFVPCRVLLWCTSLCRCVLLYCVVMCFAVPFAVFCCVLLWSVLRCVVFYYAVFCCSVLCCVFFCFSSVLFVVLCLFVGCFVIVLFLLTSIVYGQRNNLY